MSLWLFSAWANPYGSEPIYQVWIDAADHDELSLALKLGGEFGEGRRTTATGEQQLVRFRTPPTNWPAQVETAAKAADAYTTPEELPALLEELAPGQTFLLGYSVEHREIVGVYFGRPPGEDVRSYRILAGHHGDERSSVEVALDLAQRLSNPTKEVQEALSTSTIYIVPMVNPDGAANGTRQNANRVDLNRNYDFEWDSSSLQAGPHPFSEPETRTVARLSEQLRPLHSLSIHAGATNLGWVWNFETAPTKEASSLQQRAERYLSITDNPDFWITEGALWYPTNGDTNDWSYGRYGVQDYTLEVSQIKSPTDFEPVIDWHSDAVLDWVLQRPTLSGHIIDAKTSSPVEAMLSYRGGVWFATDAFHGRFDRIVSPGPGTLEISAFGYAPKVIELDDYDQNLQIQLKRLSSQTTPIFRGVRSTKLPVSGGMVLVSKIGQESQLLPVFSGVVSLTELAPGIYDLTLPSGEQLPKSLWVESKNPPSFSNGTLQKVDAYQVSIEAITTDEQRIPIPFFVVDESTIEVQSPANTKGLWVRQGDQAWGFTHQNLKSQPKLAHESLRNKSIGCQVVFGYGHWGNVLLSLWICITQRRRA